MNRCYSVWAGPFFFRLNVLGRKLSDDPGFFKSCWKKASGQMTSSSRGHWACCDAWGLPDYVWHLLGPPYVCRCGEFGGVALQNAGSDFGVHVRPWLRSKNTRKWAKQHGQKADQQRWIMRQRLKAPSKSSASFGAQILLNPWAQSTMNNSQRTCRLHLKIRSLITWERVVWPS